MPVLLFSQTTLVICRWPPEGSTRSACFGAMGLSVHATMSNADAISGTRRITTSGGGSMES